MPRYSEPFRSTQKIAPGGAFVTTARFRGGAFPSPAASGPWHSTHSRRNSFSPALRALSCPANGFVRLRAFVGALSIGGSASATVIPDSVARTAMQIFIFTADLLDFETI